MGGIDGQRGEDGEDVLAEVIVGNRSIDGLHGIVIADENSLFFQGGF